MKMDTVWSSNRFDAELLAERFGLPEILRRVARMMASQRILAGDDRRDRGVRRFRPPVYANATRGNLYRPS